MKALLVAALAALLTACGSGPDAPSSCASPSGLYEYVYTQDGGDCPAIPSAQVVISPALPAGCEITSASRAADNCAGSASLTCQTSSGPGTETTTLDSNADASIVTGTLQRTFKGIR